MKRSVKLWIFIAGLSLIGVRGAGWRLLRRP